MNNKKSGSKTLLVGQSSTQIADFVRRSAELLGIIMAYVVYKITTKDGVCDTEKGNVIPGLVIALLGVAANTLFRRKYSNLNKFEPNAIIAVQARLYRAKSLVDGWVSIALLSVALFPTSAISFYLDFIGSVVVAMYLVWCGIKTIMERINTKYTR